MSDKKWLTAKEAAEYIGTTRAGLYEFVRRGQIKAHRLGKKLLRFLLQDLEDAIVADTWAPPKKRKK